MFTKREIALLKQKLKHVGCIYWRDIDGVAHRVKGVNMKWTDEPSDPDSAEPVAVLESGKVVALYNVSPAEFVTLQPISLGEAQQATLYVDRVIDTLALLCYGQKPPRDMVEAWFRDESEALQDWAVNHSSLYWATGIGTIEAAIAMADTPEEGISGGDGPEHQMREEAFPREYLISDDEEGEEPPHTPLEHMRKAFDLSSITYVERSEGMGIDTLVSLFVGDKLDDPRELGRYTLENIPEEVLRKMDLNLYEFDYEGCLISC